MNQKYRVGGALFENNKNGPAYTGFIEIDGVKTKIALWPKRSAKGDDYLQISENKTLDRTNPAPQGQPQVNSPFKKPSPGPVRNNDMDDDIPF